MKYTEFVKANYSKVANLPAKQRMAKLGQMWRASGKGVAGGDVAGGIFIKRKAGQKGKMKRVRGKGILSDTLGAFGLGVPEGKGVVGGSDDRGSGILSDTLGAFGLGMKKRGRKAKGAGILSDTLGAFGLGVPEGKGVAGGNVAGGSLFSMSSILGAMGLGMPNKQKLKHFNRMKALEKQLHEKDKLTPAQHNKLKVYHTLHGAGFFDNILSGIKKGASAVASVVPHAITAIPQVLKVIPEAAKFVPAVGKLAGPLAKVAPLAAML